MIAYITLGANDLAAAERFYCAVLINLGYELEVSEEGLSFSLPSSKGKSLFHPELYVKTPFDGANASNGNGTMIAFEARSQKQVRDLYSAALSAGGTDEGRPGFRALYSAKFYVAYLRDPTGNKIAIFSSNPDEPGRDG